MVLVCGIGTNKRERPTSGTRPYKVWTAMLKECAEGKSKFSVCRKFKNYTFFYDWYESQIGSDKDFRMTAGLLDKANKTYHYDKCVLVPVEISGFLRAPKRKSSELPLGVDLNKTECRPYIARLSICNDRKYLGVFKTAEEAFAAYKQAKESEARRLAEKYRHEIDPRAYAALMNYTVDITN